MPKNVHFLYNGAYGVTTDENGLYYMRARYYNPDIKRFINQDIKVGDIGSSQSLNRYAYCEGNPVSLIDPFGLNKENPQDQGEESKYQWLHNLLGLGGVVWDGFDFINGLIYAAEGDKLNAVISLACGIPVFGSFVAGVTRGAKTVRAISATARIVDICKTVGKLGNMAASAKALYGTYQEAQTKCETTGEKLAYIAGTMAVGFFMGKAAKWGAGKIKNLVSKAMPKFKTTLQNAAGKFVRKISNVFAKFKPKGNKPSGNNTIDSFKAPPITRNAKNELANKLYILNEADMKIHVDGKNPGKSQFLYDVDANKAVLDAAAYADANDLWVPSSGNGEDFANKAKVYVENGPVGVTGNGNLTNYINVYRTKTRYIHGSPGNP